MNNKDLLATIMTVILLNGCAVTPEDCDPSSDGFIKGVTCKVSGSYDERIKQREEALGDVQKRQDVLGAAKSVLETEHTAKSQLVVEEREEVRQLGIQINDFQDRIDSVTLSSKQQQAQQQALLTQLATLQAKATSLKTALADTSMTTAEYEQAKQENQQLRLELDALMQKADAMQM